MLLIAGILALTALPRMTQFSIFDQVGFADQTKSALRYAQKMAIAQRRWVKITDQTNGFSVTYCAGTGSDGCLADTASCGSSVADPARGLPLSVTAPNGVALAHAGANPYFFDCEGKPADSAGAAVGSSTYTLSSAGNSNATFTVETESGYVHP